MKYKFSLGKDRYHQLEEIKSWCKESIGPGGYVINDHCLWKIEHAFGNTVISIRREKDAALFTLRWM